MKQVPIFVIGASAGGVGTMSTLLSQLKGDFPGAIFVAQHISARSRGGLPQVLQRSTDLKVSMAKDAEEFAPGNVYVAPPDFHLTIDKEKMLLSKGPRENRTRPAIDPLFRSAAIHHGPHATGVLLTGMLDDGVAGLLAVKRCNGSTVVQNPDNADYRDLPKNALEALTPDFCVNISEMGETFLEICRSPKKEFIAIPPDIQQEVRISQQIRSDIPSENRVGELVPFSCPDCGGPLWEMHTRDEDRFRCHVGHGFTALTLAEAQDEALERVLWIALRTLEEKANLQRRLAKKSASSGHSFLTHSFETKAQEVEKEIKLIQQVLQHGDEGSKI